MIRIGWRNYTVSGCTMSWYTRGVTKHKVYPTPKAAGEAVADLAMKYEAMTADFAKFLLPVFGEDTNEYVRTLLGKVEIA